MIEWSEPIPPTDAVDVAKGCRRLQQPQLVLYLVAGNQLVPVRLKPPVTKGVGCLPGMHWAPGVSVRTLENGYKYRSVPQLQQNDLDPTSSTLEMGHDPIKSGALIVPILRSPLRLQVQTFALALKDH